MQYGAMSQEQTRPDISRRLSNQPVKLLKIDEFKAIYF